jgi:hypothetical protein
MATINLLPRKEFEITLDDGSVITGQFGTWALKRYCDKQKLSLSEAGAKLSNPSINDISEYLLAAVEYLARKKGEPFSYTDVHVCDWIDQLGGLSSEGFSKIFNHSADDVSAADEEKKTVT